MKLGCEFLISARHVKAGFGSETAVNLTVLYFTAQDKQMYAAFEIINLSPGVDVRFQTENRPYLGARWSSG